MSDTPFSKKEENIPMESTRQLLEELDALMQRMLALPVGNEKPAEKTTVPTTAPTTALVQETAPTMPDPPLARKEKPPFWKIPDHKSFGSLPPRPDKATTPAQQVSYQYSENQAGSLSEAKDPGSPPLENSRKTTQTMGETASKSPLDPSRFPKPFSQERLANLTSSPVEIPQGSVLDRARKEYEETQRRFGWILYPLRVVNRTFDVFTYPLGPLGNWLRDAGGRGFLAWVGGLLMVGALGWGIYLWMIMTP